MFKRPGKDGKFINAFAILKLDDMHSIAQDTTMNCVDAQIDTNKISLGEVQTPVPSAVDIQNAPNGQQSNESTPKKANKQNKKNKNEEDEKYKEWAI